MVAHHIRKLKRKARKKFHKNEEHTIDLGLVRGSRTDSVKMERETSQRSSALTCPQLLALSGALGALPQVALGAGPVSGLPDWGELSSSLRNAQLISFSAPVLTMTSPLESPKHHRRHHDKNKDSDRSHSTSSSDLFAMSHRNNNKLGPCRSKIRQLVESKQFQQAILCAILINTLSMGVEYHLQVRCTYKID